MNADGSPGVNAELAFGAATASNIDSIAQTASMVAVVLVIGGLSLLIYRLLRQD